MQLQIQLVHAEAGRRVVQATAWEGDRCLGSALGEGPTAEEAEDRAVERLRRRLGAAAAAPTPASVTPRPALPIPASPSPPPAPPVSPPAAAPSPRGHPHPLALPLEPSPRPSQAPAKAPQAPSASPTPPGTGSESVPAVAPEIAAENAPLIAPPIPPVAGPEPPADPEDWSDELAQLELELRRLGWGREQEAAYLQRAFGHPSRSRLTRYADLVAYLAVLRRAPLGAEPAGVPEPVRRRDLLEQSDQLLQLLQWDASLGRAFLERHFALSSRQQLSDEQLLRFNLLLEEELTAREDPLGAGASGAEAPGGEASAPTAVTPQQ